MNRTKQIAIALVGLSLLFGLGYGMYRIFAHFRPDVTPSCFDGVQNQDETAPDCGGAICKSCEVIKDLTLFDVQAIPTKDGFVDLFAELANSNLDYGVPVFTYTFQMYDNDNKLLGEKSGTTFILPNSTKYIAAQAVPIKVNPAHVKLTFGKPLFQEVKNYIKPRLTALNLTFDTSDSGFLRARGSLSNQTNFNFDKVYLLLVLRDDAHRLIALNGQEASSLLSNEKRFFELNWAYRTPFFTNQDVQIDTNIFDDANIIKSFQ